MLAPELLLPLRTPLLPPELTAAATHRQRPSIVLCCSLCVMHDTNDEGLLQLSIRCNIAIFVI